MSEKSINERLVDIIVKELEVDKDKVILDATFIDDLGADSLDLVELIMAIEEEFDIEIPDDDAEKIVAVEDALDYIVANIQSKGM